MTPMHRPGVDGSPAPRAHQDQNRLQKKKTDLGALPPNPRSLSREQHPAVSEKDRARLQARSPAVTLADGCSGRTPAEPYPSAGIDQCKPITRHRPPHQNTLRERMAFDVGAPTPAVTAID
jgi:hypothetical protein